MTAILVSAMIAMGVTCAVAPLMVELLRRKRVLDHPSARSSHTTPVPRGGGVAPAVGAVVAIAATPSVPGGQRWAVALAAALFGLLGLLEDLVGIRALRRLVAQFVVAAFACLFLLDPVAGPLLWRLLFTLGAVFWLVGYVNAYNFMDGIDGISIAQAVGAGVAWFLIGTHADSPVLAAGGVIVAGAALGFAPWNLPHARMFLGDVGSYFIGGWLGALAVAGVLAGVPPEAVLAPLALYVADTGVTLARRIARGERWCVAHRDHAYQRLADAGWSHIQASAFVAVCIAACGALGAVSLGSSVPARILADMAIAAVLGAYLLSPRWMVRSDSTMAVA